MRKGRGEEARPDSPVSRRSLRRRVEETRRHCFVV